MAGGVVQGVSSDFKPQYCRETKKEKKTKQNKKQRGPDRWMPSKADNRDTILTT
jgi:hypothetical protein